MALTTSARMGSPWSAAKFPTVSSERRTAKFLSGRALFRNIPKFMSARRSKRYDSCNWATNGHTEAVEPFVFRKPCTNDLIVSRETSFRQAHIHLTAYELTRRMAEAVSEGFRVASSVLDAFLKTREVKVVDPVEVIRKIAEERKLSQKLTDEVVSSYLIEPDPNWYGVINAFTNAAQRMAPLQRIELERFAGTLLNTSLNYFVVISHQLRQANSLAFCFR